MSDYDHLSPTMRVVMQVIARCTIFIYALIAALLIIIALLTFFDAVYLILHIFTYDNFIDGIIEVLNVLLLTIIVVEVLETVIGYFRTSRIMVRPILIAGLTAMVRKVLILTADDLDLRILIGIAGIIAVLTLAIYYIGKTEIETAAQ
ncbi:phosphate-starvation-inducible PsiE family protein [Methanocalculus sp. MSAO_Arc2]|uniref:phosphate-starvation-inducible PsiE family protein n=1 Tax=Methanocalculus sp. MSAO_Arc2 TaxID=2293855 RepID=UPI0032178C27